MSALMKYWNDPAMLAKIGERLGDVNPAAAAAGPATAPVGQPAASANTPEINNLLDAAKCVLGTILDKG